LKIDHTHDPDLHSWVNGSDDHPEFPIQNLPFCCFRDRDGNRGIGVGIGEQMLCLQEVAGLFDEEFRNGVSAGQLNEIMNWPADRRLRLRHRISELLSRDCDDLQANQELVAKALKKQTAVEFVLPCMIRDYTDFYASIFHATNVGSMFRPTNPLLPNYKYVPIGYHGRASSIVVSGTDVRRPVGQQSPVAEGGVPEFGPCKLLDYELEVGFYVAGQNELGSRITIEQAEEHLFGFCLVNDWSARDIQKWEYQPLGPFLAKSFATTISPWIVTTEALAPFRCETLTRPAGDPKPLNYLSNEENEQRGLVDLNLEVWLESEQMRKQNIGPMKLSHGSFRNMYWTPAQMITHHSVNGCNLTAGDLMASGTVSGQTRDSRGCLLELTWDGDVDNVVPGTQRTPLQLPTGEERKFLADGDRVILGGYCKSGAYRRIGFGQCSGTVVAAIV
jgi:fumarylacetoacetase